MRKKYMKKKNTICTEAITFCRISSEKQEKGASIEAQRNIIYDYCKRKNLTVIKEYEITESTMQGDRKLYHEMLAYIQKRAGKTAIVVNCVDRLQRSDKDNPILDDLRRQGKIEIHFIKENMILTKDSRGDELLFWKINVLMANSYVISLAYNVKRSMKQNMEQGKWQSFAPIGYLNKREEDGKATLIKDPDRFYIIQQLFQEFANGGHTTLSIWKLAQQLGLYSKMKKRKGIIVSRNTVYDVLTNPFYAGFMLYEDKWIKHQYEPLISKELFDRVQEKLTRNGNHNRNNVDENAGKSYIFRGIIHCKECGCLITPETKTKKAGQVYVYLRCGHSKKDHAVCHQCVVNENVLIKQLEEELFNKITLPSELQELLKKKLQKDLNQTANFNASIKSNATNLLTQLKVKEDRLLDFYLEGKLPQAVYDSKKAEIDAERKRLQENSEKYKIIDDKTKNNIVQIMSMISNIKQIFNMATTGQKNQMLELLLKDCKLNGQHLEYELNKPFDKLVSNHDYNQWVSVALNSIDEFEKIAV